MPNRRATQPLNSGAVNAADEELYSRHENDPRPNPLYDAAGNRRPLDACDPAHAALRTEWMDLYIANGGEWEPGGPNCDPVDPVQPCPGDDDDPADPPPPVDPLRAHIVVIVRTPDGAPIEGADVAIDGATVGLTDSDGTYDHGEVDPGVYEASTLKVDYDPDHDSQTDYVAAGTTHVFVLTLRPPIPPCNVTTETVVTSPRDRARRRVGVGERVNLTIAPGPGTWSIDTGGTLNTTSGSTVEYTAGDRNATSRITVTGPGGCRSVIEFTVVEPSGGLLRRDTSRGIWHRRGLPSVGFHAHLWLTPSDVSFEGITWREKHCAAVCTGYFLPQDGLDHVPGSDLVGGPVDEGVGTKLLGTDNVQGADGGIGPPHSDGTFTWPIPWEFQVGGGTPKEFMIMNQVKRIDATGKLSWSKGGLTISAELNDPDSNY